MIGKGTSEKRLVSIPEALEILEGRKKEGELGYEQELAYEYAKKLSKIDVKDSVKMRKDLEELGFTEKAAIKIVDIMPLDIMQLKQTLIIERKTFADDLLEKAMEIVEKHRGK
jgi:DNA-directed RNA polymerase subunit F